MNPIVAFLVGLFLGAPLGFFLGVALTLQRNKKLEIRTLTPDETRCAFYEEARRSP